MHTIKNANLDPKKQFFVACLIERLKINCGYVIGDELFIRFHKITTVLLFLCLITILCRLEKVPKRYVVVMNEFMSHDGTYISCL